MVFPTNQKGKSYTVFGDLQRAKRTLNVKLKSESVEVFCREFENTLAREEIDIESRNRLLSESGNILASSEFQKEKMIVQDAANICEKFEPSRRNCFRMPMLLGKTSVCGRHEK